MAIILSCHLHDTIEIACLYGFEICLQLDNKEIVEGKAMTTQTLPNKTECLLMLVADQTVKIEITDILTMQAITQNPHFDLIEFR
jgi:Rho-binding antiterminator